VLREGREGEALDDLDESLGFEVEEVYIEDIGNEIKLDDPAGRRFLLLQGGDIETVA